MNESKLDKTIHKAIQAITTKDEDLCKFIFFDIETFPESYHTLGKHICSEQQLLYLRDKFHLNTDLFDEQDIQYHEILYGNDLEEKQLFDAVKNHNINEITMLLMKYPDIRINRIYKYKNKVITLTQFVYYRWKETQEPIWIRILKILTYKGAHLPIIDQNSNDDFTHAWKDIAENKHRILSQV
jgi:hypothetical protein